ncbi:hypothetical protein [Undibacterium sp. TS12]|uniref:hypothetical protein n=1 Tax=Undibacterium sp. TS12 TaxID=2908202 RepID=UPI001F4CCDFE|nr:hypothetical protein [Undibacterium sp. TS12]MCH8617509.1 hypothetical protein [Undibacterium sp. TS12]
MAATFSCMVFPEKGQALYWVGQGVFSIVLHGIIEDRRCDGGFSSKPVVLYGCRWQSEAPSVFFN